MNTWNEAIRNQWKKLQRVPQSRIAALLWGKDREQKNVEPQNVDTQIDDQQRAYSKGDSKAQDDQSWGKSPLLQIQTF